MRDRLVFWRFREGPIAFPPSYRWRKKLPSSSSSFVVGGEGAEEGEGPRPMAGDFTDLGKLR